MRGAVGEFAIAICIVYPVLWYNLQEFMGTIVEA